MGACISATISPSVTYSQRQMMRPYLGRALRMGFHSDFSSSFSPALLSSSTTRTAMAGDELSPGDSMPPRLTNPSTCLGISMIKSLLYLTSGLAHGAFPPGLSPANSAIEYRRLSEGTRLTAPCQISSNPSRVMDRYFFSSISRAFGPMMVLPCTVVVTRIPLLVADGTGKSTLLMVISALSKTCLLYTSDAADE